MCKVQNQDGQVWVEVAIQRCHEDAKLPGYARENDAGMDIYALQDTNIAPGQTVAVRTGLKAAIPPGYEIQIRPRSGMSLKTPLRVANSPGTIDAGYRDEIGILLHNTSSMEHYPVKKGDRIAQMVLQRVPRIVWEEVEDVTGLGVNRGGGFGSSGR